MPQTGTSFRAPLAVRMLDGTRIEIVDSTGALTGAITPSSFAADTLVTAGNKLEFRATANYVYSPATGKIAVVGSGGGADDIILTAGGGGGVTLTGTLAVSAAVSLASTLALAGVATIATNVKLQFRDTATFINSPNTGKLAITATAAGADDITITGSVTLTGALAVSSNVAVTGTLAVTSTTTLTGNLTSNGHIIMGTTKEVRPGGGTATSTAGAATISKQTGVITTESLTTAGLAAYTMTLTNTLIAATSVVLVAVFNGSNSQGTLAVGTVTPGSGSAVILIQNIHATQALSGTIKIAFLVLNPQ